MRTIVFIGSHQFGTSKEALEMAEKMGYRVVLFTDKKSHPNAANFPEADQVVFIKDLLCKKKVLNEIEALRKMDYQICACVSFIDPYISYTAGLAKDLGLYELSIGALSLMENKLAVRETLKDLSASPFFTVYHQDIPMDDFVERHHSLCPLILKSPASNGSKDIFLAGNQKELKSGLKKLRRKYSKLPILIEEYLIGPQYLIQVFVHNGQIKMAETIEQEFTDENIFIINGYKFPSSLSEEDHTSLYKCVEEIVQKLGLTNGVCHLEMRRTQEGWKLVEINPRMAGGAMNRILEEGTGINLIKEILKLNLGEPPSLLKTQNQYVYAKYLTFGTSGKLLKVTGEEDARKHEGIKYVYVRSSQGKIVTVPYSMGNRYACIIAASDCPERASAAAIAAAQEIKFYLEPF